MITIDVYYLLTVPIRVLGTMVGLLAFPLMVGGEIIDGHSSREAIRESWGFLGRLWGYP